MQITSIANVIRFAAKPGRLPVMAKKLAKRFQQRGKRSIAENRRWIQNHCTSFADYARGLDAELWDEAAQHAQTVEAKAREIRRKLEHDLGGGGAYPLLYFMVRHARPEVVVETGVVAGYSSLSLLSAMHCNNQGTLYSSDFPYFRLPNPEQYIGIAVDDHLKGRWELYTDGDEANLPAIAARTSKVDLFHYDSDKSYSGRQYAMSAMEPILAPNAIIIMDDIQDNSFFHDHVCKRQIPYRVFEFEGKYVGMLGEPPGAAPGRESAGATGNGAPT